MSALLAPRRTAPLLPVAPVADPVRVCFMIDRLTRAGTESQLIALIRELDRTQGAPTLVLVHGTPTLNTVYWTEDRPDEFCLKMASHAGMKPGDVIAFGHTHKPWHRQVGGIHFVNTGSVGRPKDADSGRS